MGKEQIEEFFRQKSQKQPSDVDWEARRDEYVNLLTLLHAEIQNLLAIPIREGLIRAFVEKIGIDEKFIGQYEAPVLVLQVGDERVEFVPKGRNIVGAAGRVDLIGEMGQVMLVVQPESRWGLVATRTPTLKVIPLDEDSLLEALRSVMRR